MRYDSGLVRLARLRGYRSRPGYLWYATVPLSKATLTTCVITVFQIRRGGVKGILVRYPDETFDRICSRGRVRGKIAIRPSMKKYSGGPTMLEIQDVSRPPRNARLNRMFIPLLMTLGIPRSVCWLRFLFFWGALTHRVGVRGAATGANRDA